MSPESPTRVHPALAAGNRRPAAGYRATHFLWRVDDGVAAITLNRPERKNPLTFASYAELRDLFAALKYADDVKVVLQTSILLQQLDSFGNLLPRNGRSCR